MAKKTKAKDTKCILKREAKTSWSSIYVATALSFVGAIQFSLYFSSMWQYLKIVRLLLLYFLTLSQIIFSLTFSDRPIDNRKILRLHHCHLQRWANHFSAIVWLLVERYPPSSITAAGL